MTATRKDALAVPIIALTLRDTTATGPAPDSASGGEPDEAEGVFQLHGDEVHFRPVRVGIAGDAYFEVLDGIAAGDTVVSGPYKTIRELRDGGTVRVQKVDGASSTAGRDSAATRRETASGSDTTRGS